MEGCKHKRLLLCEGPEEWRRWVSPGELRGGGAVVIVCEEVRIEAGLDGGGVIPLWKMYWSSWKNRSKKREEQENLRVRGTGALACGWTHGGLCLLGSFQVQVFPSLTLRERRSCPWLKGPALDGLQPLLQAPPTPGGHVTQTQFQQEFCVVCGEWGHGLGKQRSIWGWEGEENHFLP